MTDPNLSVEQREQVAPLTQLMRDAMKVPALSEEVRSLEHYAGRLRELLAAHCWTYFRVEDPAHPLSEKRPGFRTPPGRYIEICHACGEQRGDPHLSTCPIGRALGGTR